MGLDRLKGRDIRNLYQEEWREAVTDKITEQIVAIVAHSRHRLTIKSVSEILAIGEDFVSKQLTRIPFLQVHPHSSQVSFVSRTFADFAAEKHSNTKSAIIEILVNHLSNKELDENSDEVDSVPGYLQESGKLDKVISFLSPEYFFNVLKRSESFTPLRRQLQIGIDAAADLRANAELVRFVLDSSAIREIETAQVSRSEIEALVATDQVAEALSLAANCTLREDRLHLLGVIARCEKDRGNPPGDEILDQIRQLHGQIDSKSLGDKAFDIAADLFPSSPDLAVSLIEQSSWAEGGENELDLAYVRLTVTAAVRQTTGRHDQDDLEKIRQRITDPRLRGFTSAFIGKTQSATQLIDEAESLETASDKLPLLRMWILENPTREDAADVAEYGLKTIVETTGYAPNARVLRELSTPLLHIRDSVKARSLVRSFDGQRTTIEAQGPTEEVVRLQLNLSVAECLYDEEATTNRLVEVYLSVYELTDIATKASCIARLLSALQIVDSSGRIETEEQLASMCVSELKAAVAELLEHTADQVDVTRGTIEAISSFDAHWCVDLAQSLNTAARREEALIFAIDSILESEANRIDLPHLRKACDNLSRSESRDHVAGAVAEYLARNASSGGQDLVESGFELFENYFLSVSDPMERCRVLCLLYVLAEKDLFSDAQEVCDKLSNWIEEALQQLEPGPRRVDAGFRVAHSFAEWHPLKAKQFLAGSDAVREGIRLSTYSSEWTFQACLRLAIRAFAGQLSDRLDAEKDIARLAQLIGRMQSTSLRAKLWGELAMHLFLQHHFDVANRVVTEHVTPLILSMDEGPSKADTIVAVSPALYRSHPTTAFGLFNRLEKIKRDSALMECADFILEQRVPSDPYEPHNNGYIIKYQDAVDVAELARKISQDGMVYRIIVALADTLSSPSLTVRFSRPQKAELIQRIESLVDSKFPDLDNIQHEGYAIASAAQLLRVQRSTGKPWQDVIERARLIPNSSDRAYVLAIIGEAIPSRLSNLAKSTFEEAIHVTEKIPCNYDRLERLSHLAEMMAQKYQAIARKCLSDAIAGFQHAEDRADFGLLRNVIDTAFKIDAKFAESLVSIADDDPARALARHEMRRRLDTLEARQAIMDKPTSWDQFESNNPDLPRSAWLALGSLNAGRAHGSVLEQLRPALRVAGQYPLSEGFRIMAWVIESAVRRYSGTSESRATIREIFEGAMGATELAEIAGASASLSIRRGVLAETTQPNEESIVVQVGERDRGAEWVRHWLERSPSELIQICDQYFGPSELDLLKLIQSVIPAARISVLTSRHCHNQRKITSGFDAYRAGWKSISDQKPPETEIVVVGIEGSDKSPIHDRSILTEQGGISLGTSWNSLGSSQDSTLRVLSAKEASQLSERVVQFLVHKQRVYGGDGLSYESFTL